MVYPSLASLVITLDGLALTARAGDRDHYLHMLSEARRHGASDEQILDAYRWGRRGLGAAPFDHEGKTPADRARTTEDT